LANGGRVLVPQVVERVETPDFRVRRRAFKTTKTEDGQESKTVVETVEGKGPELVWEMTPEEKHRLPVTEAQLNAIRRGLVAVTQEPGGTAYWRRSRKVTMAGKTGTAQVASLGRKREKSEDMEYFTRDHAWFAAYAPVENPEIVVVVVNEHAGHGSSKAAPIATRVIDAYFRLQGERVALAEMSKEALE
jgi:penicillin-binding protein 2